MGRLLETSQRYNEILDLLEIGGDDEELQVEIDKLEADGESMLNHLIDIRSELAYEAEALAIVSKNSSERLRLSKARVDRIQKTIIKYADKLNIKKLTGSFHTMSTRKKVTTFSFDEGFKFKKMLPDECFSVIPKSVKINTVAIRTAVKNGDIKVDDVVGMTQDPIEYGYTFGAK